jgi:ribosomal protein S7
MTNPTFDVFISYSGSRHQRAIAKAIESGLRRFGRRWYKINALRVFRDTSNLTANPNLWRAIEDALSCSRSLVYLASPEAAASKWVFRELTWWLDHHGSDRLIFVIVDGNIAATDDDSGLNPAVTDCIPRQILDRLNSLPLYIDLRGLPKSDPVDLRHPVFTEALPQVAAAVRGVSLDQIVGEVVRQRQLRNRAAAGAVVLLGGLIAAGALSFTYYRLSVREATATALWNRLEFSSVELRPHEIDALWNVAASDLPLFKEFWSQVEGSASNIRKLGARTQLVARTAGLGVSPQARVSIESLVEAMRVPLDPDQVLALASVARTVPLQIDAEQAETVLDAISKAIQAPIDVRVRGLLVDLFTAFAPQLTPDKAVTILEGIPLERADYSGVIKGLAPKLAPQQAAKYVTKATAALQSSVDSPPWYGFHNAVAALAPRLAPERAAEALGSILKAIETQTDSRRRTDLARLLGALASRLGHNEAERAAEALSKALQTATDTYEFIALTKALAALPRRIPAAQINAILGRLIKAIEDNNEVDYDERSYRLGVLMDTVGSLPVQLTLEQATTIFNSFHAASRLTSRDRDRDGLGQGIRVVALKLEPKQVPIILEYLTKALHDEAQEIQNELKVEGQLPTLRLSIIVDAILALQVKLTSQQTELVLASLIGAGQADFNQTGVVVQVFPGLQPEQADTAIDQLLNVVRISQDPFQLRAFIKTIKELPLKLTAEQETVAFDSLFRAIQAARDPHHLDVLAQAVATLGAKPTAMQTGIVFDRFLTVIKTKPGESALRSFIGGVAALPSHLTTEQTTKILSPHLVAVTGADNKQMRVLIEAIGMLPTQTTAEQTTVMLDRLLMAIKHIDEFLRGRQAKSSQRFALIEVLKVLTPRLPTDELPKVLAFACVNLSNTGDDFEEYHWSEIPRDEFEATHWAEVIDTLLQLRPEAEHMASLIEVLKYPTAADKPTKVLLSGLRRRLSSVPESLGDAVKWIVIWFPELEMRFGSPPDRICGSGATEGGR